LLAPGKQKAIVNLPVMVQKEITLEERPGEILLKRDGKVAASIKMPDGATLSKELAANDPHMVRCLRIPLPLNGSPAEVSVSAAAE